MTQFPLRSARPLVGPVPLALACGLALSALALTSFAKLTGIGVLRMPETPIAEYRDLAFRDLTERGIDVLDPRTGAVAERLALAEGGGFIQNVLRGMNMDRKAKGVPAEAPYRVARHGDGRLYLHDPATGRRQTVDAFGPVQTAVFARLLSRGREGTGEKR